MNRALITALGVVLMASACSTTYEVHQSPSSGRPGVGTYQGAAASPPQGQFRSPSPERYELPQTRELKPDGPLITTLTPLPAGVAGTFSKDPATGRVTEYVGSRPNEQEAQCIRHKPDGTEECALGVRNGNMCTPHMPIRACVNRTR